MSPTLSAALTGFVETTERSIEEKNRLLPPNPYSDTGFDFLRAMLVSLETELQWREAPDVQAWLDQTRLNVLRELPETAEPERLLDLQGRFLTAVFPALTKLHELAAEATPAERERFPAAAGAAAAERRRRRTRAHLPPDRGRAPGAGDGQAPRALLRPRLRPRVHPVHGAHGRPADWEGLGRGLLVLAVLWWAWVGYAWLTSVDRPRGGRGPARHVRGDGRPARRRPLRARGLRRPGPRLRRGLRRRAARPHRPVPDRQPGRSRPAALGRRASRSAPRSWSASSSALPSSTAWARARSGSSGCSSTGACPAVFGIDGWRLVPGHFAERHNLVIILALGESIVALGVGAEVDLDARASSSRRCSGSAWRSAFWWIYFDIVALVDRAAPRDGPGGPRAQPAGPGLVLVPALPDGGGDHPRPRSALDEILAHVDEPLDGPSPLALLGGSALYLLAHVALRSATRRASTSSAWCWRWSCSP